MLAWIENTPVGVWVDVSPWAYPFLLTMHGLGMAVVVGLTIVIALRVLGFPKHIPLGAYQGLLPLWLCAFAVNFASGAVLWTTDAQQLTFNTSYQIKMVSIVLGCTVFWQLNKIVLGPAARDPSDDWAPPAQAKFWAIAAIVVWWCSVIVSGRLVAYLAAAA